MGKKGKVPEHLKKYLFKKKGARTMGRKGKRSGGRKGRRSGGYRRYFSSAYHKAIKHKIPLTATFAAAGAAAVIFNLLPTQRAQLFTELSNTLKSVGLNYNVNGYTIMGVLVAVSLAAAIYPPIGQKANAVLGKWGVKL